MKRQVFYSFHYKPDSWRAAQVRNIGALEGNQPATDNDWEAVKRGGDAAIRRWIADQMHGRSCTVVLVGTNTANRKWINYEIVESWKQGMGVVGIHIHGLKDMEQRTAAAGDNPFDYVELPERGPLSLSVFGQAHRRVPIGVRQPGVGLGPLSPAVFGNAHRQASMGIREPGTGLLSAAVSDYPKHGKPSQFGRGLLTEGLAAYKQRGLSTVVECHEPAGWSSKEKYDWITEHLAAVVEEAIHIRKRC